MILVNNINMQLDNFAIEEFQRLYFQEYGIRLTGQEAVEYGKRLIQFIKVVYGRNLPERKNVDIGNEK